MSGTSSKRAVLVLADADDAGVMRLVSSLATRLRVTWWRFGLPETSVSVHADADGFTLNQPGASLSSDSFRHANVIVYRRRLLQPRPVVISELSSPEDRSFSEREWTSLLDGLLLAEERRCQAVWLNSPSTTLLTSNKLSLLLFASRAGLPIPSFSVSTPVRFPSSAGSGLITKAISADERIDAQRYFTTAALTDRDMRNLPGARTPTPSLLQEKISPSSELRVFYALGEFLALALEPSEEHVDIRHAPRAALSPRPYELPAELQVTLAGVADAFHLGYCTFDLVVPQDGPPALVDITPNGDWDHFETEADGAVTAFLSDTIAGVATGEGR